jgi:hypothetical protein
MANRREVLEVSSKGLKKRRVKKVEERLKVK